MKHVGYMKPSTGILNVVTAILIGCVIQTLGCEQYVTRNLGGAQEVTLPQCQKLEMVTWKGNGDLWFLTRPMREGEQVETHTFSESSMYGALEGTITIHEVCP